MVVNPNKLGFENLSSNIETALTAAKSQAERIRESYKNVQKLDQQKTTLNQYLDFIKADQTSRPILLHALGVQTLADANDIVNKCNKEYDQVVDIHNNQITKLVKYCNKYIEDKEYGKAFQGIIDSIKSLNIER